MITMDLLRGCKARGKDKDFDSVMFKIQEGAILTQVIGLIISGRLINAGRRSETDPDF